LKEARRAFSSSAAPIAKRFCREWRGRRPRERFESGNDSRSAPQFLALGRGAAASGRQSKDACSPTRMISKISAGVSVECSRSSA
jgi:hypothetical protein